MAEVDKAELIKLGEKYLLNNEKQRARSYKYFDSKRNDAECIEKMREARRRYYYKNRQRIRETMNNRYREDTEYYNKIRSSAKEKYAEKKKSDSV